MLKSGKLDRAAFKQLFDDETFNGSSLVGIYLGWVKDGQKEGRYASKHLLWTEEEKIDLYVRYVKNSGFKSSTFEICKKGNDIDRPTIEIFNIHHDTNTEFFWINFLKSAKKWYGKDFHSSIYLYDNVTKILKDLDSTSISKELFNALLDMDKEFYLSWSGTNDNKLSQTMLASIFEHLTDDQKQKMAVKYPKVTQLAVKNKLIPPKWEERSRWKPARKV